MPLISEAEYLSGGYDPECELHDGVLVPRTGGTTSHSYYHAAVGAYLYAHRKSWNVHGYCSQTIRIRAGKYMIPDICVVSGAEPDEQIFTKPPLLVIEILLPEDRVIAVNDRVQQWRSFGVPYVWVIDPETLESELHDQRGRAKLDDGVLRVPGTPIEVPLRILDERTND